MCSSWLLSTSATQFSIFPVCFSISSTEISSHTFWAASHILSSKLWAPGILETRVLRISQRGSMGLRSGDNGRCWCDGMRGSSWASIVCRRSIRHNEYIFADCVLHAKYMSSHMKWKLKVFLSNHVVCALVVLDDEQVHDTSGVWLYLHAFWTLSLTPSTVQH